MIDNEWIKILYKEAWNQGIKEADLMVKRSNFYSAMQFGLITALISIDYYIYITSGENLFSLVLPTLIIGSMGTAISYANYYSAIQSVYIINTRLSVARYIERVQNFENMGLGSVEHRWRNYKGENKFFYPFKEYLDIELNKKRKTGAYKAITRINIMLIVLFGMITAVGVGVGFYWVLFVFFN